MVESPAKLINWLISFAIVYKAVSLGEDEDAIPFSLIAAGVKCSNTAKVLSFSTENIQKCAELVCADPQCGPIFDHGGSSGCACLEDGHTCQEVKDASTSRYQITDVAMCQTVLGADCFATLHENGDFSGWSASFPQGAFGGDDFEAAGAVKGGASAIYVSSGCIATLYQNADFSGWSVTFPDGSYTAEELVERGARDDEASAIVVRHPDAPDPLGARSAKSTVAPATSSATVGDAGMAQEAPQAAPEQTLPPTQAAPLTQAAPPMPAAPPRQAAPPTPAASPVAAAPAPRPPPVQGPAPPRPAPQYTSATSRGLSSPPKRCSISVAKELAGWECDLASKKGCTEEELAYLSEVERMYELPRAPGEAPPPSWRGDLEKVEADALTLYFTRNNVRQPQRLWQAKRIAILMHLCARGNGQPWGLDAPRKRREEL